MNTLAAPSLHQPLPPDVIGGLTWGPFHYRRYPVFSLPWLKWRMLTVVVVCALYGGVAALSFLGTQSLADVMRIFGFFVGGSVFMAGFGPALATWVRHRRWASAREVLCITCAVVIGVIAAFAGDYVASLGIHRAAKPQEVPATARKISDLDKARIGIATIAMGLMHVTIGGGVALMAYFSERRRLRAREAALSLLNADMRLAVLQAQVEPHFLFNTLASIRPLIRQDAAQAEAALDALTHHLRATIPAMRASLQSRGSTLGQQLDICRSYLAVMQVRMGARLHTEIHATEDLCQREFPPMLLLSLVENAIKHGIEPKRGAGSVAIAASASSDELRVRVTDDGVGLQPGLSSGIGLANIREQLAMRFGRAASLQVAARPEGGTIAEIIIPSRSAES